MIKALNDKKRYSLMHCFCSPSSIPFSYSTQSYFLCRSWDKQTQASALKNWHSKRRPWEREINILSNDDHFKKNQIKVHTLTTGLFGAKHIFVTSLWLSNLKSCTIVRTTSSSVHINFIFKVSYIIYNNFKKMPYWWYFVVFWKLIWLAVRIKLL